MSYVFATCTLERGSPTFSQHSSNPSVTSGENGRHVNMIYLRMCKCVCLDQLRYLKEWYIFCKCSDKKKNDDDHNNLTAFWVFCHQTNSGHFLHWFEWGKQLKKGGCGSEVEPASCHRKDRCFHFPWSACRGVLGQDTEPQTASDVLVGTLHGSHHHRCMNVWITVCQMP